MARRQRDVESILAPGDRRLAAGIRRLSQCPVEHDLVDTGVVVEVLDVAQVRRHAGDVGV